MSTEPAIGPPNEEAAPGRVTLEHRHRDDPKRACFNCRFRQLPESVQDSLLKEEQRVLKVYRDTLKQRGIIPPNFLPPGVVEVEGEESKYEMHAPGRLGTSYYVDYELRKRASGQGDVYVVYCVTCGEMTPSRLGAQLLRRVVRAARRFRLRRRA